MGLVRKRGRLLAAMILALAMALGLAAAAQAAGPITRLAGVPALEGLKKYETIPNFRLGGKYDFANEDAYEDGGVGGQTLESVGKKPLRLAYIAVGTPQRDDQGRITNAVIVSSYYTGDATFMYNFWHQGQPGNEFSKGPVVGPGQLIDTDKFYVIFLDAVGMWGTSKPSDGLGLKFPRYNEIDYAQANYRLLKDKLKVAKVKLATGVSMGGIQSYIMAALHPDFVEAIMPVGGISATDSSARWLFTLATAALESDPVYRQTKGRYYHLPKDKHPNQGVMFSWSVLGQTGLSFDMRAKQPWSVVQKEVFYWNPTGDQGANLKLKAADFDLIDMLYRNHAGDTFDINDQLARIKAKTLIIHVKNDQWLRYVMAEETAKKIGGAKLVGFEDPLAHYAVFRGPNMVKDDVLAFFQEIGLK